MHDPGKVLAALLAALVAAGCAWIPVANDDRAILDVPGVVEASGSADDALLGVHFIRTVSLLHGTRPVATPRFTRILEARNGDWSLELFAPAGSNGLPGVRPDAVQSAFARTTSMLSSIFENTAGRRFAIYLMPTDAAFDRAWWTVAVRDGDAVLHFAYREPPDDAAQSAVWQARLMMFLAHEYSHSYFWFHPRWFASTYADEVVAYSVQRCVQVDLTGSTRNTLDAGYQALFDVVAGADASTIYRRYHGTYPDTYLGNVAAERLFRDFVAAHDGSPKRRDLLAYCAGIANDHGALDLASAR
jgi:hypothetical protein